MSVFAANNWLKQKGTFSSQLNKGFGDRYVCGYRRMDEISGPKVSSRAEVLLLFHCVILGFGIMLTLMTNYLQYFQTLHLQYQWPEEEKKTYHVVLWLSSLRQRKSWCGTMIDLNWSSKWERCSGVPFLQIGRLVEIANKYYTNQRVMHITEILLRCYWHVETTWGLAIGRKTSAIRLQLCRVDQESGKKKIQSHYWKMLLLTLLS